MSISTDFIAGPVISQHPLFHNKLLVDIRNRKPKEKASVADMILTTSTTKSDSHVTIAGVTRYVPGRFSSEMRQDH